jgi:hypothetical protein
MTPVVVLIVCKSLLVPHSSPINEENAKWTGHEKREWAIEGSQMQCRRVEVPLTGEGHFTPMDCQRAAITEGVAWDQSHKYSKYRWWRSACPVPIVNTVSGDIIGWKLPECPRINHKDRVAVHCDVDIGI